ncbi:hypothetical protein U9M48_001614 [Paspalum notatum var. saurae]|uniref:Cathepsin propeptide inhibitor domain-containing protein n=1 Tax=Paspalum notatum var. saurae TaxID=547442 RepID=A0AAQ3SIG1_PASNO
MAARSAALCVVSLVVAAMALLAPTQASFIYTEEDLASEDSMWALYQRWAAYHEVACDKTTRFPSFKKNARELLDKQRNKGKSFAALNIFGDTTFDEFITFWKGEIPVDEQQNPSVDCDQIRLRPQLLPLPQGC